MSHRRAACQPGVWTAAGQAGTLAARSAPAITPTGHQWSSPWPQGYFRLFEPASSRCCSPRPLAAMNAVSQRDLDNDYLQR
jgi:hypothetical protein